MSSGVKAAFIIYGNAITSVREFELSIHRQPNRFWSKSFTIEKILDTPEATITCSPSEATLAEFRPAGTLTREMNGFRWHRPNL